MAGTVKSGQWYTYCCHKDLQQADEDFTFEGDDMIPQVWDSKLMALVDIAESWAQSSINNDRVQQKDSMNESVIECLRQIKEAIKENN
jgi:hypothetical protein